MDTSKCYECSQAGTLYNGVIAWLFLNVETGTERPLVRSCSVMVMSRTISPLKGLKDLYYHRILGEIPLTRIDIVLESREMEGVGKCTQLPRIRWYDNRIAIGNSDCVMAWGNQWFVRLMQRDSRIWDKQWKVEWDLIPMPVIPRFEYVF